jgi:hypothetical protein
MQRRGKLPWNDTGLLCSAETWLLTLTLMRSIRSSSDKMDALGWYEFSKDEYFRWKYTGPNRYQTAPSLNHYRLIVLQ